MWLGYVLHTGLATLVTSMLDSSRMAIVFDLDETLLVANSLSSITNKIESAQKNRYVPTPPPQTPQLLPARLEIIIPFTTRWPLTKSLSVGRLLCICCHTSAVYQ